MMHRFFRLTCYTVLALVGWHYVALFCRTQTAGFTVARVQTDLPYDPQWSTPPASPQLLDTLHPLLAQPFHYLGKGGQCFAFVSEDGRYVLKFFKHRFYKPYEILLAIPLPGWLHQLRERKLNKLFSKIARDCASYKIAYEKIPQETGLLYLHLHPDPLFSEKVTIYDKLHIAHTLELNSMAFILQKRAESIPEHFEPLIEKGDLFTARQELRSMLATIQSCAEQGIIDDDPGIHRNMGFIAHQPLFIDVGRFKKVEHCPSLAKLTSRFRAFLETNYPVLVDLFDEELHAADPS